MRKDPSLQINVARLTEAGLDVSLTLAEDWFQRWQQEQPDLEFSGPGRLIVKLDLARHGRDILLRGHLEGSLLLACSRCLEPFATPVAADFDILLAPGPEPVTAETEELSAADLDVDFYAGDTVNLDKFLREQVLLLVPLKPLCKEDCQGLCPHCGVDRNREQCDCQEDRSASPLAFLAKLKR